jgi:ribokinase
VGAFAVALSEGCDPVEATRRGNIAGALATTRTGAQSSLPEREAIDALLKER